MNRITLSELTYDLLEKNTAWRVIMDTLEDEDASLEPAYLNSEGEVSADNEEVWCMCSAKFYNGTTHKASSMCRGDSDEGPLLWSIWNGEKDVSLLLPPAPPPVLKAEGPDSFAAEFGLKISEVFPIELNVIPVFETNPVQRKVILTTNGVERS